MTDETPPEQAPLEETSRPPEDARRYASAISWGAVLAGAAAAAALSLVLLVLGTGLGLSSLSAWASRGAGGAITWSAILWLTGTAVAASGLGGYLAGRLRIRWPATQVHEVFFRDTAHGFLTWAVATLLTVAALTSVTGKVLGAGAASAAFTSATRNEDEPLYVVDSLFRLPAVRPENAFGNAPANIRTEMARIFAYSIRTGPLTAEDARYAAQLVAQNTGLSQQDAEARVQATYNSAQQRLQVIESAAVAAADRARRNAVTASLWVFVSMLLGAFSASLAATIGGRRRDNF